MKLTSNSTVNCASEMEMTKNPISGPTVIYDFGSNNGDDIPYYLKKADIVVAVEANPILAEQIRRRFRNEISANKLIVENCVLTVSGAANEVTFYIHKLFHVKSQFPRPGNEEIDDFDELTLPARNVLDLINAYGKPFFIKIDVEHYDEVILEELFSKGIRPPFISAEVHSVEVFSLLVTSGKYRSFNLVDGASVANEYNSHLIHTKDGAEFYSFPPHSAGPFGDDIRGQWMTPNNFFTFLAFKQLGWKDVHATNLIRPDPHFQPFKEFFEVKTIRSRVTSIVKKVIPVSLRLTAQTVKKRFFTFIFH